MLKKILCIILILLGIILIGTGIYLSLNTKPSTTKTNTKKDKVEKIIKILYSDSSTKSDIIKTINIETSIEEIPLGKDSYLKQTFNVIDNDYLKVQEEYSNKIENYILSKFKYTIKEDNKTVEIKFKSFNYYEFIYDLSYLKSYLEKSSGVPSTLIDEDYEEYSKYSYKALVKAMTIMYSYIDDYDNNNEITVKIDYNSTDKTSEYYNLFESLIHKDNSLEVDENKINNILNKAITDGIVKVNDPLSIDN